MPLSEFIARLRVAGVQAKDPPELRVRKELLVFALALTSFVQILWIALYSAMGLQVSATLPLVYLGASIVMLGIYISTLNFKLFSTVQLGLFLFFPFVLQLSLGDFINASGVILWGLLAPVSAILLFNARESAPWFLGYIALLAMSAFFDYQLADAAVQRPMIPLRASVVFFGLNFAAMGSIVYLMMRYAAIENEKAKAALHEAHQALQAEQDRSERLLLNILPGPVAERLKQQESTIADGFADVTVMFADIVNFTTMSEGMSPQQIFAMLNRVFSSFDALAEQHGLEKIKTIGDAYMVAGGLNDDPDHNYSIAIANMAIDMRALLERQFAVNGHLLELRIGIGTGPVVAGVVGKKKFIYDLWGDTVNIASRITSEGGPGNIQVDLTTYRRIRDSFDFEAPHTVTLKGKGETVIYRLRDRRALAQPALA